MSFALKHCRVHFVRREMGIPQLFYLINSTHIAHCKLMFTQSFRHMVLSSIKYTRIINRVYPTLQRMLVSKFVLNYRANIELN